MTGKIIKGIAGFYVVESGGHTYMCKARGIFRKDGRKPLVGDLVRFSEAETADSEANIEELLPRTSELIRPAVCNVDQTLVVLAVRTPDPQFLLLDEYLVTMERQNVPAAILFNKADLDRDGMLDRYRRIYGAAGFQGADLERSHRRRHPGTPGIPEGEDDGAGRSFGCREILSDKPHLPPGRDGDRRDQQKDRAGKADHAPHGTFPAGGEYLSSGYARIHVGVCGRGTG